MGCGASSSVCARRVHPHTPPTLTPTPQPPQAQVVSTTVIPSGTEEATLNGRDSEVREEGTTVEVPEGSPELGQITWKPGDSGEEEGDQGGGEKGEDKVGGDKEEGEHRGGGDKEERDERGGGDKGEEVEGELIQVESIASGDLEATFGTKVEVKHREELGPVVQPVKTHGRDAEDEEPTNPREGEEGGGGEGVELTLVEAIGNKDGHEDEETKEEVRKEDVGGERQDEVDGTDSGDLIPVRETQPTAQVIHVKPVAGTSVVGSNGKAGGLKSSSSSSLTRIQIKPSSGDKPNGRENAKAPGSLAQLKSASATHIIAGRRRERGTSPRFSRSQESLKAASQAYASVSRSRESLKKAASKPTSKSHESLKSSEQQMTERPREVPLKATENETTPSADEVSAPGRGDSGGSEEEAVQEREDKKPRPCAEEGNERVDAREEEAKGKQTAPPVDEKKENGMTSEGLKDQMSSDASKPEGPDENEEQKEQPSEGTSVEKREEKGEPSEDGREQAGGVEPGAETLGTQTPVQSGLTTTTADETPIQPGEKKPTPDTKETEGGKGGTENAEADSMEALLMPEATTEPSNHVEKVQFEASQEESGKREGCENKPMRAEMAGSKSSLRGSRVKLTSSNKRSSNGSKSSLNKPGSHQPQHEEGDRKTPSPCSLKVDKKTGQSESSIMEAVERSKGDQEGGGHEATKETLSA